MHISVRTITVVTDIMKGIVLQTKRKYQLSRVDEIFSPTRAPPKVCEMGGIHILPGLTLRNPLGSGPGTGVGVGGGSRPGVGSSNSSGSNSGNNGGSNSSGSNGGILKNDLGPSRSVPLGPGKSPNPSPGTGTGVNNSGPRNVSVNNVNINRGNITGGSSSFTLTGSTGLLGPSPVRPQNLALKYPSQASLPRAASPWLSKTFKKLFQKGWAAAMWRHCIALVILDIRWVSVSVDVVLKESVRVSHLPQCSYLLSTYGILCRDSVQLW